jgi:predicted Ser/Thr protein kinase
VTPEQRRRVRDLFEAALDRISAERAAWIDHEASDDPAVRDEVRSLLDHEGRAGSFLECPVLDRIPELLTDDVLAPGTIVGSYAIIRELGRGGMGRVYLASDGRLGRTVALKALAPHLTRDKQQRERLRREARAAASLTHPGICTVYALEEIDGELYIATEFVDGRTLREEMGSRRWPASADVLRTARELASALASAHDHGVTHRDLKPENVMRTGDGRLKILDFGLARIDAPSLQLPVAPATAPGMLIGTPAYMAPEQLTGHTVDRRADVFALGVLLYEYASGVHPFEAESPLATLARVLESEARPLAIRCPDLPVVVADVIGRCLRKAPADRFQSASEIVGALDQAGAAASPPRVATWWRVHQFVVIALYLGAAALAWRLKEWIETPTTIALFMVLGIGTTIGCVLRGHMMFTERVNRSMLAVERHRTARAILTIDVALAVALTVDGLLFVAWPLTSMLTISLAVGIALAATVLEPATIRAAFGDQ